MTGRDLIVYILQNNLENESVFKNGKFVGFITDSEAAVKLNVGVSTIHALLDDNKLQGVRIGKVVYICDDFSELRKEK